MEMGVGGWFNSGWSPPRELVYGSYQPRSRGGKEGDRIFCTEISEKHIYPCCKGGQAQPTWKRTKACSVVLDHWHQNMMIILRSLDLSLFTSLFLVLPVLTLNNIQFGRRGLWFPKWPPLSSSLWEQEGSESWHLPVFHADIYPKFKGNCFGGVNTHPQMQANYANRVTAGWTRAAVW